MKEKIIALCVLALIVLAIAANAVILDKSIKETIDEVASLSLSAESSYSDAEQIYKKFKEKEKYISITVNHEDLTNIDQCFADMIGNLSAKDSEDAEVAKYRLVDSLEHLRRSCGLNIDSII